MPDLAGEAVRPAERAPVHDDPRREPGAEVEIRDRAVEPQQVRGADPRRGDIVVDRHREPGPLSERRPDRELVDADVVGVAHRPAGPIDLAGHADAHGPEGVDRPAAAIGEVRDHAHRRVEHALDAARDRQARPRLHAALAIEHDALDLRAADVEPKPRAVRAHHDGSPAKSPSSAAPASADDP